MLAPAFSSCGYHEGTTAERGTALGTGLAESVASKGHPSRFYRPCLRVSECGYRLAMAKVEGSNPFIRFTGNACKWPSSWPEEYVAEVPRQRWTTTSEYHRGAGTVHMADSTECSRLVEMLLISRSPAAGR